MITLGADVNQAALNGKTPLFWACVKFDLEIVKILLEKGATVTEIVKDTVYFSGYKSIPIREAITEASK